MSVECLVRQRDRAAVFHPLGGVGAVAFLFEERKGRVRHSAFHEPFEVRWARLQQEGFIIQPHHGKGAAHLFHQLIHVKVTLPSVVEGCSSAVSRDRNASISVEAAMVFWMSTNVNCAVGTGVTLLAVSSNSASNA